MVVISPLTWCDFAVSPRILSRPSFTSIAYIIPIINVSLPVWGWNWISQVEHITYSKGRLLAYCNILPWRFKQDAMKRVFPPGAAHASSILSPGWGFTTETTSPAAPDVGRCYNTEKLWKGDCFFFHQRSSSNSYESKTNLHSHPGQSICLLWVSQLVQPSAKKMSMINFQLKLMDRY